MNWLIIAPQSKDPCSQMVEEFLQTKFNIVPYEIVVYPNIPVEELYDDCKHILQTTHCIIIDSERMYKLKDYNFILGLLTGKQVKTFIYEGRPYIRRYEVLEKDKTDPAFFRTYSQIQELLCVVEKEFPQYVYEDEQHTALVKLFALGIPFTSDCFAQFIAKDDTEICQLFFKAGMLTNACTSEGVPLICIATRNDCDEKVKWLLENGADINAISSDRGYSAVMDAVWRKNYSLTKYLIEKGADLSFISSDGQPIMVLAVGNGNAQIVELLMQHGADADIKDSMGMTAREYADLFKRPAIMQIMGKYPPKSDLV